MSCQDVLLQMSMNWRSHLGFPQTSEEVNVILIYSQGSFPSTELAGTEHSIMMANRANFTEDSESHSNNSHEAEEQEIADESESDNPGEDTSSDTSGDDALMSPKTIQSTANDGYVKQEIDDGDQLNAGYFCPLCHAECGSPEQLIAHVYKHTTVVGTRKSYVCPVCGRALSSPGSLGRHLLIHSEDRLSNCAVCGARFTVRCTFSRSEFVSVGVRAQGQPLYSDPGAIAG
ncbi:ZN821 protein, partial [Polypterus senegalus]